MRVKDESIELMLTDPMWTGLIKLINLLNYRGYETIITSGSEKDPIHKTNSKHFVGDAVDLRSRHIPTHALKIIQHDIGTLLPNFTFLIESDHIHFQRNY